MKRFLLLFLAGLICLASLSHAQKRYYYKGRNFGSEALYNPFSLYLNGSFDIIQLEGHTRDFLKFPYGTGFSNVLRNLGSPFGPISRYGLGRFLRHEVFPFTFKVEGAQWWPNYQLHLIGGGMTYVAMREWYEEYGVPAPRLMSLLTVAGYHLMNEAVENGSRVGDNIDPVADIYFFDIPGIILFSFDGVNEFFSSELNLADWSLQPSIGVPNWSLENNGQNFSVRWKLPFSQRIHLFYYFGLCGVYGLSYKFDDGSAFSAGCGLRAVKLNTLDVATNTQSVDLRWNLGLFYDRDNSLLASLFLAGYYDNAINLNIYPGVFQIGGVSPGLWTIYSKNRGWMFGIAAAWVPGIAYVRHR